MVRGVGMGFWLRLAGDNGLGIRKGVGMRKGVAFDFDLTFSPDLQLSMEKTEKEVLSIRGTRVEMFYNYRYFNYISFVPKTHLQRWDTPHFSEKYVMYVVITHICLNLSLIKIH